jgi:hypothetical protein
MGYTTKDIAIISEPKRVSLSALPNFVQFKSKPGAKVYLETNIKVNANGAAGINWPLSSVLRLIEPSGVVHAFSGTTDPLAVGGAVFYIVADITGTAENLRQAMLADKWVAANFELRIPSIWTGDVVTNGDTLNIKSKGAGSDFNITIAAPNNAANVAYLITPVQITSTNNDSISGEASTVEISLDVYADAPIFLGADDRPLTSALLGSFALSLSKTYSGGTLWFDINAPFSKSTGFNIPPTTPGWFNTGTLRVFRFNARVTGVNNFAFYQSNALYILRGYGLASDPINLDDYTYVAERIKLLSNKPRTIYVKGQREYLNFMFSDADRGATYVPNWTANILYRAYDTLGEYLGQGQSDTISRTALSMVNTCVLRIDDILTSFPTAGLIRVSLARGGAIISSDLEYTVRPASLHTIRQFSFLNRLGGWDSFNFDAAPTEDIKTTFDTFTKTVTPTHTKSEGIETTYAAQLDDVLTIVGAPVTDAVAEWLKELGASTVVLDGNGNYVIKSEFTLPSSEGTLNMQVPTMKYKLSETYTNE